MVVAGSEVGEGAHAVAHVLQLLHACHLHRCTCHTAAAAQIHVSHCSCCTRVTSSTWLSIAARSYCACSSHVKLWQQGGKLIESRIRMRMLGRYPVLLRLYVGVEVVAAVGVAAEVAEPHVETGVGQQESCQQGSREM